MRNVHSVLERCVDSQGRGGVVEAHYGVIQAHAGVVKACAGVGVRMPTVQS
jgi:hypothetical protein